ncbi:hypothetical protein VTK73DRAFT_5781 [Phialemonium thermophilum]|uniref:Trafficking protein particle complex II-specific subunit 65 IgD3 domain-containing protein n=1 Tax=Phialemonium thermophilum TaxID=223376 RepID=A0ABR3V1H7_9PEZI
MNLLEPLAGDPAFRGVKPRLSSTRVSRVAPITRSGAQPRAIKGLQGMSLRIFPLAHTRIRFSRPNTSPPSPALIALLEMDFSPFFDCEAVLDKITLHVDDGIVEDLNTQDGMRLPLRCVAHDHVTFLYHLAPNRIEVAGRSSSRELGIAIGLTALVQPDGPNRCIPRLSMAWTAALDFTLPLNPGFGQPLTQPIQRSHRPSQLSIGGGGAESQSLVSPSVSRPDALPSLEAAAQNAAVADVPVPGFGITMTFVGPQQPVRAGEEFSWTVFVQHQHQHQRLQHPRAS